jgi:hypothetical protein
VQGEPMVLPLKAWHELVPTGLKNPMYPTTVPVREEFAARVSLQQLTLIGGASPASVGIETGEGGAPRTFVRWKGAANFDDFVATAGSKAR